MCFLSCGETAQPALWAPPASARPCLRSRVTGQREGHLSSADLRGHREVINCISSLYRRQEAPNWTLINSEGTMGFSRAWQFQSGLRRCHAALENNYNRNDDASEVGLLTIHFEQMCFSFLTRFAAFNCYPASLRGN